MSEGKGTPEGCPSVCPSVWALICPHRARLPPGSTPPRCAGGCGRRAPALPRAGTSTHDAGGWGGMFLTAPVRLSDGAHPKRGLALVSAGDSPFPARPPAFTGRQDAESPVENSRDHPFLNFFVICGQRSTGSEELEDGGTSVHVRQSKTITDPLLCC